MIALIKFEKDLVIERNEAELLGLQYEEHAKYGIKCSYGKEIQPMVSKDDYYTDELDEVKIEGDESDYYTRGENPKKVSNYSRYDRLPSGKDYVYVKRENNLVDLDIFAPICKHQYMITKCVKQPEATIGGLSSMINKIEEKFATINKGLDAFVNQQFNEKVNVHVGGGLIVTYNDLKLMEDSCTDVLQNELNDGWRIIAVCVQPDSRRPDYILGRYNPSKDCCETRAKRK